MWFKDENIMLNLSKSNIDILGVIKNEDETYYVMCCFNGSSNDVCALVDNITFETAEKFLEKLILLIDLEKDIERSSPDDLSFIIQEYKDEIDILYSHDVDAKTILKCVDPIGFSNGKYKE